MLTARFKTTLVILTILLTTLSTTFLFANCDMFAGIAKEGYYISWMDSTITEWDDPYDFIEWLKIRSRNTAPKPNYDGYGFLYYKDDGYFYLDPDSLGHNAGNPGDPDNQAWYQKGFNTYYTNGTNDWKWELDKAKSVIMDNDTESVIVFGHARKGTGGEGNHPFRFNIVGNEQTYTFMHNGWLTSDLDSPLYNYLDDIDWFETYQSNWDSTNTNMIDSEIFFHYLMKFVIDNNGNIIAGIHDALTQTNISGTNINYHIENPEQYYSSTMGCWSYKKVVNFVLSDGENLYVFRNSPSVDNAQTFNDSMHTLSYNVENDFIAVKTYHELDTRVDQFDLVIIPRYGEPYEIPDFLDIPHSAFISTDITNNQIWNENKYISSDITISNNAEITLSNSACVKLIGHCNLTIDNAKLNIANNTQLQLFHSSQVLIDTGGLLFLNWGSTITGTNSGWYEQIPPGHQASDEEYIPGDRIIAINGGIITTGDDQSPGDEITIGSSFPIGYEKLWDGIYIENPADTTYWFVNCNISYIKDLCMKGTTRNPANLKLYKSTFHDNAQLMIRDGHKLFVEGSLNDSCYIENNAFGIVAYNSQVNSNYASITGNGTGISMNYACVDESSVTNSNISNNDGSGIIIRDRYVSLEDNIIINNTRNGIISYKSTVLPEFSGNTINNNGWSEYAGYTDSYLHWSDGYNSIDDLSYSYNIDKYILKAFDWQLGDEPINLTGNPDIVHSDTTRFYPYYIAFEFDEGEIPTEREMLNAGMDDMKAGNYSTARTILEQLIIIYPGTMEAASALQGIYFIENYTDRDFATLLNYIDAINAPVNSFLKKAKRDIKIKVLIQQEEYTTAIDSLEVVIANPSSIAEEVDALIDEAYCYVKLLEQGSRTLLAYCTITPSNFNELHETVRELENRLFEGEENEPEVDDVLPACITLTNYPNPFNPETTIQFSLPEDSKVELSIYNVKGQKVKTLTGDHFEKGAHSIIWNGNDNNNKSVSSGIYFYKLSAGKTSVMKKMLLLK